RPDNGHMFDALRAAVQGLEIPIDGDAIAELFAIRDRLDAKLNAAVGEGRVRSTSPPRELIRSLPDPPV
ncbi:MAG TPA: hypothetical protein VMY88_13285, partial [Acidimicrobiales bacterium]|nr:hypothetical protein [Acidimicrobiales bacterium]